MSAPTSAGEPRPAFNLPTRTRTQHVDAAPLSYCCKLQGGAIEHAWWCEKQTQIVGPKEQSKRFEMPEHRVQKAEEVESSQTVKIQVF